MCTNTNYYSVSEDNEDEDSQEEAECVCDEMLNVEAGIRGRHNHNSKLHMLNYK